MSAVIKTKIAENIQNIRFIDSLAKPFELAQKAVLYDSVYEQCHLIRLRAIVLLGQG